MFGFRWDLFENIGLLHAAWPSCPGPSEERESSQPLASGDALPPPGVEQQTQQLLDEALQQPLGGHPSLLARMKRNKEGIKVRGKADEEGGAGREREREVKIVTKWESTRSSSPRAGEKTQEKREMKTERWRWCSSPSSLQWSCWGEWPCSQDHQQCSRGS